MASSAKREARMIAMVACPECGAARGVDCHEPDGSPVPWPFKSPPSTRHRTMHRGRRKAYSRWRQWMRTPLRTRTAKRSKPAVD